MKFNRAWLAYLTAALIAPALAAETLKSEEVSLSASVAPTPLTEAGVSVHVLSEAEIEKSGTMLLTQLLRMQPGIQVIGGGGLGAPTAVSIRGEDSYRTQLWIDGMPLNNPAQPQVAPALETIGAQQWQRIEVLRGPQGLAYGGDSGGVISLYSPGTDQPFAADLRMQAGGHNSQQVDANVSARSGRVGYFVSASQSATRGFNASAYDSTGEFDAAQNTTWHGKVAVDVNAKQVLKLVYRDVDHQRERDLCFYASGESTQDCDQISALRSGMLEWAYRAEHSAQTLAVSESEFDEQLFSANQSTRDEQGRTRYWRYTGHKRFGQPLTLSWGVDYKIDSKSTAAKSSVENTYKGAFVEGLVSVSPNFHYSIATRLDSNDDFGDHTSYRFSTAYLMPTQLGALKLRAAYGTGYRSPSLQEQYGAADALTEEHSHGGEVGLEWGGEGFNLGAVAFQTKIEDRIGMQGRGYVQLAGVRSGKGLEVYTSLVLSKSLQLSGDYTFNEIEVTEQDPALSWPRPQNIYNVALHSSWLSDAWKLAVAARGARFSERVSHLVHDYDVLTLTCAYQVASHWSVHLRVENAADALYQEIPGYATSRRKGYLATQFSF